MVNVMEHYGFKGDGVTLVTDNYYASIESAKNMFAKGIRYISTARKLRLHLDPPKSREKKFKKG